MIFHLFFVFSLVQNVRNFFTLLKWLIWKFGFVSLCKNRCHLEQSRAPLLLFTEPGVKTSVLDHIRVDLESMVGKKTYKKELNTFYSTVTCKVFIELTSILLNWPQHK